MKKSEVIAQFGTMAALASAIGVSARAIAQWPEEVPAHRAAQIREAIRAKIGQLEEMVK